MDKKTAICRYLYRHHRGKRNAVYSRELERLFSIDGRNLRRKISALRQDGYPICSDESGYYYADNLNEITNTVQRLSGLATKISKARNGLLYTSMKKPNDSTLEVSVNIKCEEG